MDGRPMSLSLPRVPTGRIDEQVTIGVDRTAAPPVLILTLMRRNPSEVAASAFRPVHTITLHAQYAALLAERILTATAGDTPA